jgi:transcriptional regulator with XRE-family HTH domain
MATKETNAISTAHKEALLRLGEYIYLNRRRLRLTQEELAEKCNAGQTTALSSQRISDIEYGKMEAKFLEIQAIASVMGKDLNGFMNL